MRILVLLLLIPSQLIVNLPARASSFFPIQTGRSWVYSTPGGASSASVGAVESFNGSMVHPYEWNNGSRELYSQDSAGRVYRHGVNGAPDGSYLVHDPPCLFMDSDLSSGHEWEADYETIYYDADDMEMRREHLHETYQVMGTKSVDVPAGTFSVTDILYSAERDGQLFPSLHFMFAEGVGLIERTDESGNTILLELESYGPGVAAETPSWGWVKSLYQN